MQEATARRPRLHVDLGERDDEPEELYRLAERISVACGGHAGDEASMRRAAELARESDAHFGAHPSYEDRARFGRVALAVSPASLGASIERQCAALARVAGESGLSVAHVKPHGALYHAATRERGVAEVIVAATVASLGPVALIGPPRGELADAARRAGLPYLREGFADRVYLADGTLAPRDDPGALIVDPAAAAHQAARLARQGACDVLSVHGDTPGAVAIAREVQRVLRELTGDGEAAG